MDNELILSAENGTEMEITGVSMKGDKGDPGYTPQKGVDYFTEEDIESLGLSAKEDVANKVTTITDASTDSQYPSAQAVYLYTIDTAISLSEHINTKEDAFERELLTQASCDVALSNKKDVRCFTTATDITLTTPMVSAITSEEEWECYLSFKSGATPTSLAYSATPIKWVGVDCDADGDFIPSANTNYEISVRAVNEDSAGNPVIVARVGVY
nr:MAG TPA: hypothetical protein [Caudoviricetes sp.]